jgi:hypothetical protein
MWRSRLLLLSRRGLAGSQGAARAGGTARSLSDASATARSTGRALHAPPWRGHTCMLLLPTPTRPAVPAAGDHKFDERLLPILVCPLTKGPLRCAAA